MGNFWTADVATVDLFDGDTLFAVANTNTDTSINTSVSLEEIRMGAQAMLRGIYAHSAGMKVNFTEGMFRLEYIAKNVGSAIEIGSDAMIQESQKVVSAGQVTVNQTPVAFNEQEPTNIFGWYKGVKDTVWKKGVFTGKNMSVADAKVGETYCVKYFYVNDSARKIDIKANFNPEACHAVMHIPLFAGDANDKNSATKVGEVQVRIKRLMFDGSFEITMNMTGGTTTPFTATALGYEDGATCGSNTKLAEMVEIIFDADWKNDVEAIFIEDADILLGTGEQQRLSVYAVIPNALPKEIANSDLTFVSKSQSVATVNVDGVVEAVGAGSGIIECTLTGKNLTTYAQVTVS